MKNEQTRDCQPQTNWLGRWSPGLGIQVVDPNGEWWLPPLQQQTSRSIYSGYFFLLKKTFPLVYILNNKCLNGFELYLSDFKFWYYTETRNRPLAAIELEIYWFFWREIYLQLRFLYSFFSVGNILPSYIQLFYYDDVHCSFKTKKSKYGLSVPIKNKVKLENNVSHNSNGKRGTINETHSAQFTIERKSKNS